MDAVRAFIGDWLDPVATVLGLLSLVPIVWTWWDVTFGRRRRERALLQHIRRAPGERPAILIMDLLPGKNIRAAVENYRRAEPPLAAIPDERLVQIERDEFLTPDDMADLYRELRAAAARLLAAGTDCIHYFHAGPGIVAALVGAEFANGARVLLYQYEAGTYRCFGPLRLP
ncbi:hypothetical protein [Immundisolibacter sp.]|uniref:hypothetical protein n=1 Tax=Immundisolibacter sp. TaxID=1934948 RepID=UPI00261D517B|nr:hypothetical protein [Immundisolibacter sp.]MDD3652187.1 hypothetical protein [Immundisolibacter sp.]